MIKIAINQPFRFILPLLLFVISARAQESVQVEPVVETEFKRVLRLYRAQDYQAAFDGFQALVNARVLHQRMTASLLMTGKSLYQLGRYAEAIPYFQRLIGRFPQSRYVDDAYYEIGACHFRLKDYVDAAKNFLWVADWSKDPKLSERSKEVASFMLRSKLSRSDLDSLLQFSQGETSAALVTLEFAKKELNAGSAEKAARLLKNFKSQHDSREYAAQIDQLLKKAESAGSGIVKVGVVLPLTGYYSEQGLGVLRGIKFAHSKNSNNSASSIQLVIRNSESDMVKAVKAVQNLVHQENVRVIIGDLDSQTTAGIGALASVANVPILAPAATENGVASVGDGVYQMNSDLEEKGEALAEYAINKLGLRTFATLAPADEYGQQMTASFSSTVDALGGRIVAQSWYYGSPQDLSRQFKSIREAAFSRDTTNVTQLIIDARRQGQDLDERDIPVLSIDGMFLPIYSEDIKYVAPQFALNNIRAQILGGEYWDELENLKSAQVQRYVNGAIFVSDYFPDEDSRSFRDFRTEFRLQMKKTPERWEVFGYDAYNLIKHVVETGANSREEINNALNSQTNYQGIKGEISFQGNNRVNKKVNFLQFVNDRIIKHQ